MKNTGNIQPHPNDDDFEFHCVLKKWKVASMVKVFLLSFIFSLIILLYIKFELEKKLMKYRASVAKTTHSENEHCSRKRIALIFFGVPKYFSIVWNSYHEKLVLPNKPNFAIDCYLHLYNDVSNVTNPRNNEFHVPVGNEHDVLESFQHTGTSVKICTSSQSEFDETLKPWLYKGPDFYRNDFSSLENAFRQKNSMNMAFRCVHGSYDGFLFLRSDVFLFDTIVLPNLISSRDLLIPDWHSNHGLNDRIAIAGSAAADIYASMGDGFKTSIIKKNKINTEVMLRDWIAVYEERGEIFLRHDLNGEREWGRVLRLRGGMGIAPYDLWMLTRNGYYDVKDLQSLIFGHLKVFTPVYV